MGEWTDSFTLISAVTTLLAAYFGARFAFKLQSQREDRERVKKEVTAEIELYLR